MHQTPLDIARIKRGLIIIGSVALGAGAIMAGSFGYTMSGAHALILALLSAVAAVMPTLIDYFHKLGRRPTALALSAIAALFIGTEYFSHLGYTVGHRVRDTEQAGVQNTKYADARESVVDHRANLAMWQDRLSKLNAQHAWAATTKADGLRAHLDAAQKAIDLEAARGGCGPKCQGLMSDKAKLEERIAIAEQASDLTKQINATQGLIDKAREKSADTKHVSSSIVNQTKFVAQLWTTSLEPGAEPMTWTQIAIGALIALVTTFLAPVCFFMAFGDQVVTAASRPETAPPSIAPTASVPSVAAQSARTHERHTHEIKQPIVINDREALRRLASIDSQAIADLMRGVKMDQAHA